MPGIACDIPSLFSDTVSFSSCVSGIKPSFTGGQRDTVFSVLCKKEPSLGVLLAERSHPRRVRHAVTFGLYPMVQTLNQTSLSIYFFYSFFTFFKFCFYDHAAALLSQSRVRVPKARGRHITCPPWNPTKGLFLLVLLTKQSRHGSLWGIIVSLIFLVCVTLWHSAHWATGWCCLITLLLSYVCGGCVHFIFILFFLNTYIYLDIVYLQQKETTKNRIMQTTRLLPQTHTCTYNGLYEWHL